MVDETQEEGQVTTPKLDVKLRPTLKSACKAKMSGPEFNKMMKALKEKYGDKAKFSDAMIGEYLSQIENK